MHFPDALELIGFSLAVMEIFFPRRAVTLEHWIDSLPEKAPRLFYGGVLSATNTFAARVLGAVFPELQDNSQRASARGPFPSILLHFVNLVAVLFFAAIMGAVFAGLAFLMAQVSDSIPIPVGLIVVVLIAVVVSLLGIVVSLVTAVAVGVVKVVVGSLNAVTKGRALGAIGLIIAAIGLLT